MYEAIVSDINKCKDSETFNIHKDANKHSIYRSCSYKDMIMANIKIDVEIIY